MSKGFGRCAVLLVLVAALVVAVPAAASAAETKVAFSALYLNGTAVLSPAGLQLTPALGNRSSSAFTPWPLTLAEGGSYSTSFSFAMYGSGGIGAADGIAFVLQPGTRTALSLGGGLGYQGVPNSVGVEFDTWFNSTNADPNDNHVGVDLYGSCASIASATPSWTMWRAPVNYAWINYNGTTHRLDVRVSSTTSKPTAPTLSCVVDIAAVCGTSTVFAGFTSATGSGWQVHEIRSWSIGGSLNAKAHVLTPVAPATMKRGRAYTISGFVEPEHTVGTYLATLKFYRRNSHGTYVYHHSVNAKRFAFTTAMTRYSARASLPHTGKWRVRAAHSCTLHATSYSGYDYITVK